MANDPMRILKADHREVEKLLDKLAESEEGAEREQMVEELVTKLSAHMEAEESIVYPPVKAEVGEEDEEEAEVEHGLAREGLEKVQQMVEMPGFGAAVEMLKGGISHHVEEEETQLLPELKESLDRDAWLALGDALVEAKRAAGLPVPQPPQRKSTKRTRSTRSKEHEEQSPHVTSTHPLRRALHLPRMRPNRRRLTAIAIAVAALATSCGSDQSEEGPGTTVGVDTLSTTPSGGGEGGVPLEPGSNLPPSGSDTTPSGSTVGSELLAPADSTVGAAD